ncbi:hypothetical protein GPLA_4568 [Paraglaciecola polaris LMG 21857]|uniref:Uncharacterized protein n=1 Tax=Paraglaciecola polaris LMG 21857 TaxID=1129793 RepID=K6ZZ21_9ALTE|nr:hypothetical protein GPLA_4568 [Paraglaciecola polaris LMG 21857]
MHKYCQSGVTKDKCLLRLKNSQFSFATPERRLSVDPVGELASMARSQPFV